MIYFKSENHKLRYLGTMRQLNKQNDQEYASAIFLLTANQGTWDKARGYVSRVGIDVEGMLEGEDFSGGHAVLVNLAGNLFNGNQHIDPLELMRLDDANFTTAVTAIQIRRNGLRLDDLK